MAGSFVSRAARALRDPWSLVVAGRRRRLGLGDRSAGRRGRAGRCRDARRRGRGRRRRARRRSTTGRAGAAAAAAGHASRPQLVGTLRGYRDRPRTAAAGTHSRRPSAVSAAQAVEAARSAESVANRVARAVDAVDDAVGRARGGRPADAALRRGAGIGAADAGAAPRPAGQAHRRPSTRSARCTRSCWSCPPPPTWSAWTPTAVSEAAQVNDSLDAIRGVFAELEADASTTRALL